MIDRGTEKIDTIYYLSQAHDEIMETIKDEAVRQKMDELFEEFIRNY